MKSVGLYVMGEPLLNPDIFYFINECKKEGIHTQFSTNGMLIGDNIDKLIDSGLDDLQIALDGIFPKTHEGYRIGSNLSVVLDNIIRLQKRKKELAVSHPLVTIQTLVNGINECELDDLADFCKENNLNFRKKKMHFGRDESIVEHMKKMRYETSIKEFNRYGNDTKYYRDMDFCPQFDFITILSDGQVVPCCFDYDGQVSWGNLVRDPWIKIAWSFSRWRFMMNFNKKKECFM